MSVSSKLLCLSLLMSGIPMLAHAEAYTALTYGSGPDGYRSYSFTGDVNLSSSVRMSLDHFLAQSSSADDMHQTGLGLSWQATELVAANYRYSLTNDGIFRVKGSEGGMLFNLDTLWEGDLRTTLNMGYGSFKYEPATPPANGVSRTMTQNRSSYGLSQDITASLSLYGSHDQYKYDRNVIGLAILLIKRTRNTSKAAFSLLAFPDKTNTVGLTWKATDSLSLDLSSGKTTTLLDQELRNARLGADYQFSEKLNIAVAFTRSSSTTLLNNSGGIVQAATRDNYWELTAGWAF